VLLHVYRRTHSRKATPPPGTCRYCTAVSPREPPGRPDHVLGCRNLALCQLYGICRPDGSGAQDVRTDTPVADIPQRPYLEVTFRVPHTQADNHSRVSPVYFERPALILNDLYSRARSISLLIYAGAGWRPCADGVEIVWRHICVHLRSRWTGRILPRMHRAPGQLKLGTTQ
jgi:hypothetical protein